MIDTVPDENVTAPIVALTRSPAVPLNVRRMFWPGTVVEALTLDPPGVIGPPASGGTSYSVNVAEPVASLCGSMKIAYVPAVGRTVVSTKALPVPMYRFVTSPVPSGLRIETSASENVTPENCTLTRWPAAPANVMRPFWPGTEIERDEDGPPGVIVPPASGGTSYRFSVIEPV